MTIKKKYNFGECCNCGEIAKAFWDQEPLCEKCYYERYCNKKYKKTYEFEEKRKHRREKIKLRREKEKKIIERRKHRRQTMIQKQLDKKKSKKLKKLKGGRDNGIHKKEKEKRS